MISCIRLSSVIGDHGLMGSCFFKNPVLKQLLCTTVKCLHWCFFSTFLDPETRRAMGEQAVSLAKAVGYNSAGETFRVLVLSLKAMALIWPMAEFFKWIVSPVGAIACGRIPRDGVSHCILCRNGGIPGGFEEELLLPGNEHKAASGTPHNRMHYRHWYCTPNDPSG